MGSKLIGARLAGVVVVAGSAMLSVATPGATAATVKNVNFKGTWTIKGGTGFVIKTENLETGACKGTTDFGNPYQLVGCAVHGARYKFTITYQQNYKSFNFGTVSGNTLHGSYKDTNGSTGTYTATRP